MSKIEKLRKKAEDAWTDCDSCNSNDKSMWINGYIVGALANEIQLPSDEEIENKALHFTEQESYGELNGDLWKGFVFGAIWMRNKIKGGDK